MRFPWIGFFFGFIFLISKTISIVSDVTGARQPRISRPAGFPGHILRSPFARWIEGLIADREVRADEEPRGKPPADFETRIDAPKVGTIRLLYAESGDSADRPARLRVFTKCDGLQKEQEIAAVSMCYLQSYKYSKEESVLKLTFMMGQLSGRRASCDESADLSINVAKNCKLLWKGEKR